MTNGMDTTHLLVMGTHGVTQGNWLEGTPFPIFNVEES